jgi:dihydroorotate dehydrogenase electron transfer subunit
MEITKIKEIVREAEGIKTFRTEMEIDAVPGQFVMAWIPGLEEKPMSLSYVAGNLGITSLVRGPFTNRLHEMETGELLGIRGPYGRGFNI